jgi:hypothetical protein
MEVVLLVQRGLDLLPDRVVLRSFGLLSLLLPKLIFYIYALLWLFLHIDVSRPIVNLLSNAQVDKCFSVFDTLNCVKFFG